AAPRSCGSCSRARVRRGSRTSCGGRSRVASDGSLVELEVGPVAHGGHCVARHEGGVFFVRHTLPGERVRAELTDAGDAATFWRADAVGVLEASPDRVP